MKKTLSRLFLACLACTLLLATASCEKEDKTTDPTNPASGEPNTVTGVVVNAQGQPMAGVKVRADNPNGNNIHAETTTDANGKYRLKLTSIGGWKIYAWKEVQVQDKTYHLRLGMKNDSDYDAFATEDKSLVRDFVWKLEGRIPDRPASADFGTGYFGGSLYFVNLNSIRPPMPAGTKVTVTLTPLSGAKYLDGTPATATVTKSFTIGASANYYVGDIKATTYRVTLHSEHNGVTRQIGLGVNTTLGDYWESVDLSWDPHTLSTGSYESGLKTGLNTSLYMYEAQQ
jgi:hypothetical protein